MQHFSEWVFVLTNQWQTDDDDQTHNNSNDGKDPVRQQLKALEKVNKELLEKLAKAETTARTSAIKDVLTEKKLNPKLANLIPSTVEATPDAIAAWLKDYEDLFPTPAPEGNKTNDNSNQGNTDGDVTDEDYVAAMNAGLRLAQATTGGQAPNSKPQELLNKLLSPDLKPEELLKMIEQHGGGVGVG